MRTPILVLYLLCCAAAPASPVHHYRLDETFQHEPIEDSAGSVDALSSTELHRGRSGLIAGAMAFAEADNDHIDFGPCNALLPSGDFTVTLWVRFSTNGLDANERILDCSDGNAFAEMTSGFNLKSQNGHLRAFIGDGSSKAAASASATTLGSNGWYLVALRHESSSDAGIVTNGRVRVTAVPFTNTVLAADDVSAATGSAVHDIGTIGTATNLLAGTPSGATPSESLCFDGLMDDLRIYDSVLSDQQLADLFNENLSVVSCLRWIFNVDGDKEGWTASGTSGDAVAGGEYVFIAAGNDPQIQSPSGLGLDLTGIKKVFVKARNGSSAEEGAVFFQTVGTPSYVGNMVSFPVVTNDTGHTLYEVDMSVHSNWNGTLQRLRIDLPSGGSEAGDEIRVDRIAVGESGNRPNVIVMLADDLGWRDVSVNGSDYYQTPNVERLAAMGVNFPNAHSAHPLCSPTRAAILTGLYPGRVRFNTPAGHVATATLDPTVGTSADDYLPSTASGSRTRLPNGYVTYAERMKRAGYSTAFLGKWHLGRDEYIPDNQGFGFVVGGRHHPGPPGGYFAPFSADSNIPATWPDGSPVVTSNHVNDVLAAWAADYIEEHRNRPFLMNMWWYDVHGPIEAKPAVRDKYVGLSGADGRQDSPTMAAMIEVMDSGIGVVLDKLEELGLTDDTVIFFTGDNGGNMYIWIEDDLAVPTDNYPSRGGKACIWDGGSHVPFIVSWPGTVSGGTVNSNLVNNMDIYATVLDMLDLEPYDGYALDSTTLVPSLLGLPAANSNTVFVQFAQSPSRPASFPGVWVRQGEMKLIRFFHGNGGEGNHRYELYNMAWDPGEEDNLANANPMLVAELDALIEQHLTDTEALVPLPNPAYVPPVFDGWTPNHGVWVQDGTGGRIRMVSNSFLPGLDSPDLSARPAPAKVRVTMTSRSYGDGRIWWKSPGDTQWSLAQSVSFPVTHDAVERTIEVPINPGAPVRQIRYQPSSSSYATDVLDIQVLDAADGLIEMMSLVDSDGDGTTDEDENAAGRSPNDAVDMAFHFETTGAYEGWHENIRYIDGLAVTNGALMGTALTDNPHFENTAIGFPAASIPAVALRMRAGVGAGVQLYWTPEGGTYTGNFTTQTYSGNGDWQVLEFVLAGNALWDGQQIDKLRIDPIASATWFEIDWIRAVNGDADNDGFPDWAEDVAGTGRLDPDDAFRVMGAAPVQLDGKAGRLYSLQWTASLLSNGWNTVETAGPLATDEVVVFPDTSNGFYRLQVKMP